MLLQIVLRAWAVVGIAEWARLLLLLAAGARLLQPSEVMSQAEATKPTLG